MFCVPFCDFGCMRYLFRLLPYRQQFLRLCCLPCNNTATFVQGSIISLDLSQVPPPSTPSPSAQVFITLVSSFCLEFMAVTRGIESWCSAICSLAVSKSQGFSAACLLSFSIPPLHRRSSSKSSGNGLTSSVRLWSRVNLLGAGLTRGKLGLFFMWVCLPPQRAGCRKPGELGAGGAEPLLRCFCCQRISISTSVMPISAQTPISRGFCLRACLSGDKLPRHQEVSKHFFISFIYFFFVICVHRLRLVFNFFFVG